MKKLISGFVGKNKDFRNWLAGEKKDRKNVIFLQRCEICGDLCASNICKKCKPFFCKCTKKIATELAANKNNLDPTIA